MVQIKLLGTIAIMFALAGCDSVRMTWQDRYGDPVKRYAHATQPQGVIDIQNQYSYRFMDKWRISHAWLNGTNVEHCTIGGNSYKRLGGYGALGIEPDAPFVEQDGKLVQINEHKGQWRFVSLREKVYGTDIEGKFQGYSSFCTQFFLDSRNGFGLFIVKPDPAKGTDEWIEGAETVRMNGLNWLFKKIPPQDMTGSMKGLAETIEIWTLPIPDTPYWLTLKFSADKKFSIDDRPVQHYGMLNLFHRIVASVQLEPITPVSTDSKSTAGKP